MNYSKIGLLNTIVTNIAKGSTVGVSNKHVVVPFCSLDSDICNGLRSTIGKFYHLRVRKLPFRSIFSISVKILTIDFNTFTFFYGIVCHKNTYFRKDLRQPKFMLYLIDASIIPLFLFVFHWVKFRSIV